MELVEVLALRAERVATADRVMASLTDAELDEVRRCVGPGHPKAGPWAVRRNKEWRHRDYAERDLDELSTVRAEVGPL